MGNRRFIALSTLVLGCMAGSSLAQPLPTRRPMDPSPAHERLGFFEGTWTTDDATPEDAFRETCAWLPEGRRHMVCRTRWNSKTGPREGMSVFSFDPATGKYAYNGFRAGGALVVHQGEERNGVWRFTSEQGTGDGRIRTRVTIQANADGGFDFRGESATGAGAWVTTAKVTYRRLAS